MSFLFPNLRRILFYNTKRYFIMNHRDSWLPGWLNIYLIPPFLQSLRVLVRSTTANNSRVFFSATTMLVPLSDEMTVGAPRRSTNLSSRYTWARVHGSDNLIVYSLCGHTCKYQWSTIASQIFTWLSKKMSKKINPTTGEGWLLSRL